MLVIFQKKPKHTEIMVTIKNQQKKSQKVSSYNQIKPKVQDVQLILFDKGLLGTPFLWKFSTF